MAIAGLHNVSVLENSFLRESQSQQARRQENSITRTSSIRQMWRQLEDEHVVNNALERGSKRILKQRSCSLDRFGSQTGNADSSSFNCERSSDLGEVERERVRQIFREWTKNCGRERTSNVSLRNNSSTAQWLGEAMQERVGTTRECGQMNSQQRGACIQSREVQAADIDSHIEQVSNGLVVNQIDYQTEHVHSGIQKLCGRQAMLDMLKNAKRERQTEVQGLQELRAVSNFAHRKRIQSLLRCRFLRNDKRVAGDRCATIAASELGLLRQKQTVSGLREGFFSRLDNSGCGPASSKGFDTPSNADTKGNGNEQNHVNNSDGVINRLNDQSEHENKETLVVDVVEDVTRQVFNGDWQENISNVTSLETLQNEAGEHSGDASYIHFPQDGEISGTYRLTNDIKNLEQNLVQYLDSQESASQVEGRQEDHENNDTEWQEAHVERNVLMYGSNEDGSLHETTRNPLEGSYNQESVPVRRTYTFYIPDDDDVQSMELRELLNRRSVSSLLRSGFRESLDKFIQSYVERQNDPSFYLRLIETSATPALVEQDVEQQSRDQNEGQRDAAEVSPLALPSPRIPYMLPLWDQSSYHRNETSATAWVEQDVEQQGRDRNGGQRDAEVFPVAVPLPSMPYWDRDSYYHYNWAPDDSRQQIGIEWDIINDLRVDLARLQQRMNNMQRMLGACMEMQLELQRTIRQEVSAAMNHSSSSQAAGVMDDSSSKKNAHNWDNVRKGICCICSKGNIDSLLYRCGHMCACSKCANELFQHGAKCPMCRAPVIEVIRAYSI
ncbi:hypothetical protein V6N12_064696 [Hibiscus sabdariffa]|uniref:RING-type domain-containing protein n=1 Tax=Hibiscus sabdariffa TaxID=183260 RepID=A0ABR2G7Y5_9ROSI